LDSKRESEAIWRADAELPRRYRAVEPLPMVEDYHGDG
jgi:hypothetical protein